MYCPVCGTNIAAVYCTKCGYAKPETPPPMQYEFAEAKYCSDCGKEFAAAYCVACGNMRKLQVKPPQRRLSEVFRASAPSPHTAPQPDNTDLPPLFMPLHLIITAIVLLTMMASVGVAAGFMLLCVAALFVVKEVNPELYAQHKFIIDVGAPAGGALFALLALITGSYFGVFSFLFSLVGFGVLAFMGLREKLAIAPPPQFDSIKQHIEGAWGVFIMLLYFYLVERVGFIIITSRSPFVASGFIIFQLFGLVIMTAITLGLPMAILYFAQRNDQNKLKPVLWIEGIINVLFFLFIPFSFFAATFLPTFSWFQIILQMGGSGLALYVIYSYRHLMFTPVAQAVSASAASAQQAVSGGMPSLESYISPNAISAAVVGDESTPSRFHGNIGTIIGMRLLMFFGPILLGILLFIPILGWIAYPIAFVLLFAFTSFSLIRWEITNTEVGGVRFGFDATFGTYLWLLVKTILLSLFTCGLYVTLGAAEAAIARWKNNHTTGSVGVPSQFYGNWGQVFTIRAGLSLLRFFIILLIWVAFFVFVGASVTGVGQGAMNNPIDALFNAGQLIENLFSQAIGGFIIALLLSIIIGGLIGSYITFKMMEFEIINAEVNNRRWQWNGTFSDLKGTLFMNKLLIFITCGIYGILGFPLLRVIQYKVTNIRL